MIFRRNSVRHFIIEWTEKTNRTMIETIALLVFIPMQCVCVCDKLNAIKQHEKMKKSALNNGVIRTISFHMDVAFDFLLNKCCH